MFPFVSWVCSRFLRQGFGQYRYHHQCFFICGLFTGGYAEFEYDLVVGWTVRLQGFGICVVVLHVILLCLWEAEGFS